MQKLIWFIKYDVSSYLKVLIVTQSIALGSVGITYAII
jgi:hypothetical protein